MTHVGFVPPRTVLVELVGVWSQLLRKVLSVRITPASGALALHHPTVENIRCMWIEGRNVPIERADASISAFTGTEYPSRVSVFDRHFSRVSHDACFAVPNVDPNLGQSTRCGRHRRRFNGKGSLGRADS
jgi:hypothetical protein